MLLWLNWRAAVQSVRVKPGESLVATLRPAGPSRPRHHFWGALPVLLFLRAFFYWEAAGSAHWTPRLPLGPVALVFRNDLFGRMLLFSVLSCGAALGIFYLWLLILSCINEQSPDSDAIRPLVLAWLGRLERWPAFLKMALPIAVMAASWSLLHFVLAPLDMTPPDTLAHLMAQGAVLGLAAYLTLEYLFVGILVLYVFNSYLYLGEFPLWGYVDSTAKRLLSPLRRMPLRIGKIDLTPVVAIALIWLAAELAERGLARLYRMIP